MKKLIALLLTIVALSVQGQQSVPAIRGEVNTYFPTNNANQIQAVRLRETFNDVLDHVDTLSKKKYGKTIAQIRAINNTTYEIVFVLNSGKQGWFYYDSSDTSTSDDNNNTIVSANGRRYKRSVLLESVTSVNGKTGIVVLTKEDVLGTIESSDIAPGAVTYAKIQNVANQRALGRNTTGSGVMEELTLSQMLDWASSTRGTILYRGAAGWAALGPGTSGHFLQTAGAGADPLWASTSIANNSITNAMLRQSSGLSIIGRSANSTGDIADITAVNDGDVMRRSGTSIGFGQIGTAGILDNNVTDAKIRQSAGLSIVGRSANSTGNVGDITAGTDAYVLRRNGTALDFGQVATGGIANNAITVGKLEQILSGNWLARISGSTGNVESITTAQAQTQLGIPNKQPNIQFQDEGANSGTLGGVSTVNFVGDGVSMSNSGATNTVTINKGTVAMGTGTQVINTTTQTAAMSITVTGGSITTARPTKIKIYGRWYNATGSTQTLTFNPQLAGTNIGAPTTFSFGTNVLVSAFCFDITIIATSTTSVHGGYVGTLSSPPTGPTTTYSSVYNSVSVGSLSSNQNFSLLVTLGTNSNNLYAQVDRYVIEH